MKGNPQTAVYLTCTKNKSLQRKHVEVCKRCRSNIRCKPYLEYRQNAPPEIFVETPADIDRSQLLRHIIQEMREIQELTHTDTMDLPVPQPKRRRRRSRQKLTITDIKKILKDIQALCKQSDFK